MSSDFVVRDEYEKDIVRIDKQNAKQDVLIAENRNDIVALKTIWANIAQMPEKIEKIEHIQFETKISIDNIQKSLEGFAKKQGEQGAQISEQKERGKIDVIKMVTDNAWKIVLALASAMAFAEYILEFAGK